MLPVLPVELNVRAPKLLEELPDGRKQRPVCRGKPPVAAAHEGGVLGPGLLRPGHKQHGPGLSLFAELQDRPQPRLGALLPREGVGLLLDHTEVIAPVEQGKAQGKILLPVPGQGAPRVGQHRDLRPLTCELGAHPGKERGHVVKIGVAVAHKQNAHRLPPAQSLRL